MPLMLLSNPGLPLAVLGNPRPRGVKRAAFAKAVRRAKKRTGKRFTYRGRRGSYRIDRFRGALRRRARRHAAGIPWSGRRGYLSFTGRVRRAGKRAYGRSLTFTNPTRSSMSRRRRNPNALSGYVSAAKAAPKQVLGLFTGPNKVKNIAFAAGGAAGTYLLGGLVAAKLVTPILARIPVVNGVMAKPLAQRVVGGLIPFTVGYIASKFVKGDVGKALLVGGAAASIVELLMPGKVGQLLSRVPGIPAAAAAVPAVAAPALKGPTNGLNGLDGYVSAPSYAGVGDDLDGYVSAPSYAGVGDEEDLAGYVSAPSYAGVGDADELAGPEDVMAGVDGYIEQGQKNYESYLAN